MYKFLKSRMPFIPAAFLAFIWYISLIIIVLYFSFEPVAEFAYLEI